MPLVRFSLMETQFFRQDSFSNFFILTFCFRRVVRYNPMVGPEMEEEVERLFYTPTPARFSLLLLISSSFNLSIRSPHTLLFAFGGWSRTGSGDAATFGPSSDIMIFNPATRFKAKCHPFSHRHTRSWSKMEQDLPQPVAYTAAAGFNNQTTKMIQFSFSGGRKSVLVRRHQGRRAVQSPPLAFPASSPTGLPLDWISKG